MAYVAQADVLNHLRVQVALLHHLLQDLEDHAVEGQVLEASLLRLA